MILLVSRQFALHWNDSESSNVTILLTTQPPHLLPLYQKCFRVFQSWNHARWGIWILNLSPQKKLREYFKQIHICEYLISEKTIFLSLTRKSLKLSFQISHDWKVSLLNVPILRLWVPKCSLISLWISLVSKVSHSTITTWVLWVLIHFTDSFPPLSISSFCMSQRRILKSWVIFRYLPCWNLSSVSDCSMWTPERKESQSFFLI